MWSSLLVLLVGCPGADTETADTDVVAECDLEIPSDGVYSVVADAVPGGAFLSVWSDGDEAVIVGGDLSSDGAGVVARYDGERLCTEPGVERALWWVHGAEPGDYWMVGAGGLAIHVVDGVRTRNDVPTDATLFGVFVDDDGVYAVGGRVSDGVGEVWVHRDGSWSAIATDLPGLAYKVWDGFVVGNGVAYTLADDVLTPIPNDDRLLTVRGDGSGTVYAVGGVNTPVVVTGDGSGLDAVDTTGLSQPLNGVWTGPGQDVWVTGNFGTTARLRRGAGGELQGAWEVGELVTVEPLHAVWPHCDEVLFVGGSLFASSDFYGTVVRYGQVAGPLPVEACP